MAVSIDNNANFHALNSDPATTSGAYVVAGGNRLLIACVNWKSDTPATITSVKYNSLALTLLDSQEQSGVTSAIYYLINPTSGSNTLEIVTSAQTFMYCSVSSWTGVHQTAPLGTPVKVGEAGVVADAKNAADTVASGVGIDVLSSVDDVPGTVTDGANQIRLVSNTGFGLWAYSSYEIGSGDMQESWTNSLSIAHIAVAIMPSASTVIFRRSDLGTRVGSREAA